MTAARPTSVRRPVVSVDELRRAAAAAQAGAFRRTPAPTRVESDHAEFWEPGRGEHVAVVLGAGGAVGATTVALGIAEAHGAGARLVECSPPHASGIAAASAAELGVSSTGWRAGERNGVLLQRTTTLTTPTISNVPMPPDARDRDLTVLDVGWDPAIVAATPGWLSTAVAEADLTALVTVPTVPGLRRLELALEALRYSGQSAAKPLAVVTVGASRNRWPKAVQSSIGSHLLGIERAGRLHALAPDRHLATTGVDSRPLPPGVLELGRAVLSHLNVEGDAS